MSTSRQRFRAWLNDFKLSRKNKDQDTKPAEQPVSSPGDWLSRYERSTKRARSARQLISSFLPLVGGDRAWYLFGQRKEWGLVLFALISVTIGQMIAVLLPLLSQLAIDHVILKGDWTSNAKGLLGTLASWLGSWLPESRVSQMWALGGISLVLALASAVISIPGRYQMTRLVQLVQGRLRRRLFDHMANLPLHRVQALKSGGVTSLLREDSASVGDLIFIGIYNPFKGIITFLGGLVMMALIDWRLVLGGLALVPTVWLTHRTWIGRIRPVYSAIKKTRQASDAHATEVFGGMRVVRTFGGIRREASRYARATHLQSRQSLLAWWWSRGVEAAWMILIPLASAGVLIYGGLAVMESRLTIGQLTAFTMYLLMLLGPMELLVGTASQLQTSLAGFDRCLDVLAEPREFADQESKVNPAHSDKVRQSARGAISVRNVSFAYPGNAERVLADVNLEIRPGSTVALVGPSGSGKTTLCNLIARFYDPTSGAVMLDGIDLREIHAEDFRSTLGIVEQDVFLFDGSIAENIAYGYRNATPEQIRQAAQDANALEFINRFERGFETLIGERGVRLSGGQKQRLAIARAILANPTILILDEATSNLDTESERLIQRSLRTLIKGRTCIVIAHRLSTIRHADNIVVLERGKIIESGTHDQLVAKHGKYQRMLHIQMDPLTEDLAETPQK